MVFDLDATATGVGLACSVSLGVMLNLGYLSLRMRLWGGWSILMPLILLYWWGWMGGLRTLYYLTFGEFSMVYTPLTGVVVTDGPVGEHSGTVAQLLGLPTSMFVMEPKGYWFHLTTWGLLLLAWLKLNIEWAERQNKMADDGSEESSQK